MPWTPLQKGLGASVIIIAFAMYGFSQQNHIINQRATKTRALIASIKQEERPARVAFLREKYQF
jgi:hypothetical protein